MNDIFVTYSWGTDIYNNKVIAFVNYLREHGFEAKVDKMLIQQESAIDFSKMMHRIMTDYKKVIIILSEGYKQKAESFSGGVGNEYSLIIKDINLNPQKYILLSFDGIRNEIIPIGLHSREVIDVSKEANINLLFHKLTDKPLFDFAPVRAEKPTLNTSTPEPFSFNTNNGFITIEKLFNETGSSQSSAGVYRFSSNEFWVSIKNSSLNSLDSFAIEVSLPSSLLPYRRGNIFEQGFSKNGERLVKTYSITSRLFPNQSFISDKFEIEINSQNIHQTKDESIIISVYSNSGTIQKSFKISDYFIVHIEYGHPQKIGDVEFG